MPYPANCDRCKKKLTDAALSKFNSDIICGNCTAKEVKHPSYQSAEMIGKIMTGNSSYKGIGKPSEI